MFSPNQQPIQEADSKTPSSSSSTAVEMPVGPLKIEPDTTASIPPPEVHADIDSLRSKIKTLYIDKDLKLGQVIEIMFREHGLRASTNMYKKKIRQWNMHKYSSQDRLTRGKNQTRSSRPRMLKPRTEVIVPIQSTSNSYTNVLPPEFPIRWTQAQRWNSGSTLSGMRQVPRLLTDPLDIKISNEMWMSVRNWLVSRLDPQVYFVDYKAPVLKVRETPAASIEFAQSFSNGVEAVKTGNIAIAGASFEKSFSLLSVVLVSDDCGNIPRILSAILESETENVPNIGRILLRQTYASALAIFGPSHPLTVWSRSMLALQNWANLGYRVLESTIHIREETLGKLTQSSVDARNLLLHHLYHLPIEHRPPPKEIEEQFEKQMENSRLISIKSPYAVMSSRFNYAQFLFHSNQPEKAEVLLAGTPEELPLHHHAPPRMFMLLHSVAGLAEARAAQGKYLQAEEDFKCAVKTAIEVLGPDDGTTLSVHRQYAQFLTKQGRERETLSVLQFIEATLEPYMLRAEHIETEQLVS